MIAASGNSLLKAISALGAICCVSLLTAGCSSVTSSIALSPVEGPEGLGRGGAVSLGLGASPAMSVKFAEDASRRPPDLTKKSLDESSVTTGSFSIGVFAPLDVFIKLGASNQWIYGARFQILGPARTAAKAGDFSLAVIAAGIRAQANKSGDQNGSLGAGGFNWDSAVTTQQEDMSLLVGYRFSDDFLLYAGPAVQNYRVTGNIHHALSSDLSSPDMNYPIATSGRASSARLGLQFNLGPRSHLKIEGTHSNFALEGFESRTYTGMGLGVDVAF